jgi:hypothetical protein
MRTEDLVTLEDGRTAVPPLVGTNRQVRQEFGRLYLEKARNYARRIVVRSTNFNNATGLLTASNFGQPIDGSPRTIVYSLWVDNDMENHLDRTGDFVRLVERADLDFFYAVQQDENFDARDFLREQYGPILQLLSTMWQDGELDREQVWSAFLEDLQLILGWPAYSW